ncbi:hypothetical protein MAHJHV47_46690 [Mycobacterium avium subsp. hominissuis]
MVSTCPTGGVDTVACGPPQRTLLAFGGPHATVSTPPVGQVLTHTAAISRKPTAPAAVGPP